MSIVISILVFIVVIMIIVLVHEFGHFFTAKKFGIRVDEFGFGFPPKIASFKHGETEYSLNALPFGGFVRIYGEDPNEENTNGSDAGRSFVNKAKWKQALVLFAGIFANLLLAWLLFSVTFLIGSPLVTDSIPYAAKVKMTDSHLIVLSVENNSPAAKAGIKEGDVITAVATSKETITNLNAEKLVQFSNQPGTNIEFTFTHNGTERTANIIPQEDPTVGRAFVGISPIVLTSGNFSFLESFGYGFKTTLLSLRDTFVAFGKLFERGQQAKEVRDSVMGPVGLVQITGIIFKIGIGYLISFVAVISVSLAAINVIPFPALDGGRLLFVLIEKIKGSRLNPKFANLANTIGFAILILLMLVITYHDVVKLF